MTWFKSLTGFSETSPQQVREQLFVESEILKSRVNGQSMICGRLETPSLAELRARVQGGENKVREVIANVQNLHIEPSNAGALFQVASQFNLLEMISPQVTPEYGVEIYEADQHQEQTNSADRTIKLS